jgi:cytoskeletal protein CcmA (bactofilin family)
MLGFKLNRSAAVSRVGRACQVDGNLQIEGPLQIDGKVCGAVNVNGDIAISETGFVEGLEIRGDDITVRGVLKAHVYAKGKLTLGTTARLEGNVIAGAIDVDPGAYYIGHLATYDSRTPFYADQSANLPPAALTQAAETKSLEPRSAAPRQLPFGDRTDTPRLIT